MASPDPIPSFYKIFFLYIDPLICLSGIYLSFLDHNTYLLKGVPTQLISPTTNMADPITGFFLNSLGGFLLQTFVLQVLLLRTSLGFGASNAVKTWKILM
jgi:hypothetical protein